jgi:transposase
VQSSRRLEREARRNIKLMWLTVRLAPDFTMIADFRKDDCEAIRLVCREFVMLCRKLALFIETSIPLRSTPLVSMVVRQLTVFIEFIDT